MLKPNKSDRFYVELLVIFDYTFFDLVFYKNGENKVSNPVEPENNKIVPEDELPPASQEAKANPIRALLSAAIVREFTGTSEEAKRLHAFLNKMERNLEDFQEKVIYSPNLSQGFRQWAKESGLENVLKNTQTQGTDALYSLENNLRDQINTLREKGTKLKSKVEQSFQPAPSAASAPAFKPEDYEPDEAVPQLPPSQYIPPAPVYNSTEVPVGDAPARDLQLDVFDEADQITVVAEHPSLQPITVNVTINHDILTLIAADLNGQAYVKELLLPAPVATQPLSQSYRNGVLEIKLKKL